jgi:hypothetical protein
VVRTTVPRQEIVVPQKVIGGIATQIPVTVPQQAATVIPATKAGIKKTTTKANKLPQWYLDNIKGEIAKRQQPGFFEQIGQAVGEIFSPTQLVPTQTGIPLEVPKIAPILRVPQPVPTKKKRKKTMDLGTLITDLGGMYIREKYKPNVNSFQAPDIDWPSWLVDQGTQPTPLQVPGMQGCAPAGYYVNSRGQVCKRRSRRRRLATLSDIKDLAALKSVLGGGEAFKTWIATHST